MALKYIRISLILWLLYPGLSLSASQGPYFADLLAKINGNIEAGTYEENLKDIPQFVREEAFQGLTCYQRGKIFHKIGVSYYLLDREDEAIDCFRDSVLAIWQDCPEVPDTERATTIYNIGICYQYLGNAEEAKQYLDDALFIFENDPDYPSFDLAKKFHGIANFYLDNYDSFRAGLYYENALNIFRKIEGTELRRFDILNNFLIMSVDFKQYEKAASYFEEAMALYQDFPESIDDYERSILYQNAGIAHFELGELEEAQEKSQSGLKLIDSLNYPILYSNAIEKIAMINGEKKRYTQAIEQLNEVVRIRRENLSNSESYQYLSYAYENLFEIYRKKEDRKNAGKFLQKALETLMVNGVYDEDGTPIIGRSLAISDLDLVRLLSLKSKLYREEFEEAQDPAILEKSLSLHAKIDTLISRQLISLQFQKSKLNFLELIQSYYGEAIGDALKLQELTGDSRYLHLAYFFSSKTKAIILQNELKEADAFQAIASPAMLEQEQALVQKMFDIQEQLINEGSSKDSLLREYIEVQRELDIFLLNIEKEEPEYYRNKYAFISPPGIEVTQQLLPKDLAVVEYFYQADTIFSFWITRDHFFQIPICNDEELVATINAFVDQCHDPSLSLPDNVGHILYRKLISGGLDLVDQDISRLCIIPDGILHTLPFETLDSSMGKKHKFLIEDYSLTYSYSIGLLFREKDRSFDIPYLGFGAQYSPELSQKLKRRRLLFGTENLSQLALAGEEINRANTIFSGKRFLDQNANLENFYEYSTDAQIIHLSLHGLVDFEDPLRSSILFDDHRESFVLSAADLYSHNINADLVILSACHSANGKIYIGEGVQGMSKAFLLSGAQSILSSLWSASEVSSLEIMTSFLQHLKDGLPKDLALHQAKLDYLAQARPSQRHPFYWANFILIGEIQADDTHFFSAGKLVVSILLLAGIFFFLLRKQRPLDTFSFAKENK